MLEGKQYGLQRQGSGKVTATAPRTQITGSNQQRLLLSQPMERLAEQSL
jgi:hypothetical protein